MHGKEFIPSANSTIVDADTFGDPSVRNSVETHATSTGVEVITPVDENGDGTNGAQPISQTIKNLEYPSVWLRVPNTSFGIPMGLAGHATMWKAAGNAKFISDKVDTELISFAFWIAALLFGVVFVTAYCVKAVLFSPLVLDEFKDAARIHFLNMPHLIVIMLTTCVPDNHAGIAMLVENGDQFRSIVFGISMLIQLALTIHIGERWMFSGNAYTGCGPPFLISLVAWFLLAVLGTKANVEKQWGIALPTFCFGIGSVMYFVASFSIFNGIRHEAKGSPALFLIMTPPSIAIVAWDMITDEPGEFAILSKLLLGCCLVFFLLLVKIGQQLASPPPSLGFYWAYVFPVSALSTGTIRYAAREANTTTGVLAFAFIAIATIVLLIVMIRVSLHAYQVVIGKAHWADPLLTQERIALIWLCGRRKREEELDAV